MALTNNTISMVLDRSLKKLPSYRCWQSCPLKVSCAFPAGSTDTLSDVTALTLEIRASMTAIGASLASQEITSFGSSPYVFDLETADMNLSIPDEIESRNLFIMVVATLSTGEIDVLSAGNLVVMNNDYSGYSAEIADIITFGSGIATMRIGANTHRWLVESTYTGSVDSESIEVTDGVATYTIDGYTHRWLVETT